VRSRWPRRPHFPACMAGMLTLDRSEAVFPYLGDTPGMFQMYRPDDRDVAESFAHRETHCRAQARRARLVLVARPSVRNGLSENADIVLKQPPPAAPAGQH